MDPRLESAINSPKVLLQAGELVRFSFKALEDLKQLDESLYERFVASRGAPEDPSTRTARIYSLWEDTFGGLEEVLAYCRSIAVASTKPSSDDAAFDFGDFGEAPEKKDELELGSSDIGDLLDGLDTGDKDDAAKWAGVLEKVSSIEYGLTSQLREANDRMEVALEAGEMNQVLGILDDTQSSSSEGVHALVAAVYVAFVPDVNAATVVPGYLTSLGRALLVRRGLADLAVKLTAHNNLLQGENADEYPAALAQIRQQMRVFVGTVVCRAMRAADRWQMVEFERELSEQNDKAARMTSEGLVKYVDSLGSINQREVLVIHDTRTMEEMRESLASARQLVDLSPRTAREEMERAYQAAQRLRGRHPSTDDLIIQLERYSPQSSAPAESTRFLERLEAVLAASGG